MRLPYSARCAKTAPRCICAARFCDHKARPSLGAGPQSDEISKSLRPLEPVALTGSVVTADALYTRRESVRFLVGDQHGPCHTETDAVYGLTRLFLA